MFVTALGVRFLDAPVSVALDRLREQGGLMVVPSGPGLATLPHNRAYRAALEGADFAIVDSAYLATLWFIRTGQRLHRNSGLRFVQAFLHEATAKIRGATFLVNPSSTASRANTQYLRSHGFAITDEDSFVAPQYVTPIADESLVEVLQRRRPRYIMLCVGGGTQEPLGLFLKHRLDYSPAILCTGAALAFLTGEQARIPTVIDRAGLGWLARSVSAPRRFVPRYLAAVGLSRLVFTHRERMPPLRRP